MWIALRELLSSAGTWRIWLFLWATGASTLLVWALREMARANRHFSEFVQEIATLNTLFRKEK